MSRSRSRLRGRNALVLSTLAAATSLLLPSTPAAALELSPAGNLPAWTQVLREDFNGALNTARWAPYSGTPGGNPYGKWSPKHIEMHGGQAWLHGYREGSQFVTAGMILYSHPLTFGKYLVRARFDRGAGIEHVMLLWPTVGWPPELDFTEGESNGETMATSHWGAANNQQHAWTKVDMTQWHTYGLEWTPTSVAFSIDGRVFARMTGAAVPKQPMKLAIQTAATKPVGAPSAATPRDVTLRLEWISIYRRR